MMRVLFIAWKTIVCIGMVGIGYDACTALLASGETFLSISTGIAYLGAILVIVDNK